jgi:glutathione peroxidase
MQPTTFLLKFLIPALISFYTLKADKPNGSNINFADFAGKKVLIVNTAINTPDTVQYRKLEQLYQLHKDSLVIIVLPSNDFGNAPGTSNSIKNFILTNYNANYIIAAKTNVKGANKSQLYKWLSNITKNGMMQTEVREDFCKYLINKEGILIGVFGKTEDPMGGRVRGAVEGN